MIETKGLRKSFQTRRRRKTSSVAAVAGLDLTVADGEIFGFLGPNGAGKTTTLRMLATLIPPDGGEAVIAGADLLAEPAVVRRRIGYIAQGGGTWDDATAREELILQARMHGIAKSEAESRAVEAIEAFQLAEYADRKCKTYSGGQRRRVDIALGVVHRPQLVFLDEPTANLDPQSRATVWEEVRRLRAAGMTVFLTTHYLDEADALCDRVAIIDGGEIVAEGTPTALKREISGDVVTVGLGDAAEKGREILTGEPYLSSAEVREGGELRLSVDAGETAIPRIMRTLGDAGIEMATIELHRPTLDDVFLSKTGRSLRES
ncbi:daunorubicin resistance protein DrrA family ABC transporter ATP-binding protein [Actinospica robiniae]|uniref:daunorubicin resistance protein DrrA family ABC transporter ATP-binding protein n=1 Tax=Actinospica robiniae TaxID=304901 RepID=UPI00040F3689|nr:daunorubicin resistance protein DrrA family ABC transporter ATP-binding protein [Actinospica robiniae]